MEELSDVIRGMRRAAGLSQRDLATRARTSQPAVARYESGVSHPSWGTLQRLAKACGRCLRLDVEMTPDQGDLELAELLLGFAPLERLRALTKFARLHDLAQGGR